MSTVTLRIQVDKSGASENINAVKGDLRGMGETGAQAGAQASTGVNGLSSAINGAKAAVGAFLAVYAGIQTLSGVVRLADEYQGLSDRLRLATDGSEEFAAAQSGVFAIAQETGTALSAVGGLYVSLTNSTKALGLSQGELQTITQAVTQSFIVSGASASQTDAAIRQLGQGFASGVLRGDEFNSMMENAPSLAAALAASLGVTTGELRAMAAEGKLTSDVLATGLLQQAPAISAQFDQMGTTVSQAFTRLSNSVLKFVGEASQSTGAAASLATAITAVANNIDTLARALGAAGVAVGVFVGARGIAALVSGFQAVATSIALSAAPIGAFITGATGAAAATSAWAVAGRALFTLMGGWVGLLAGVAAGVYYLATAQTEAEKTADAADAAITKLRTATGELRPAALAAASATLTLAEAQLKSAYAALAAAEAYSRSAAGSLQYAGNLAGQARSAQGARDEVNLLANSVLRLRAEIASGGDFTIIKRAAIGLLEDANVITKAFGVSIVGVNRATLGAIPPAARLTEIIKGQAKETREAKSAFDGVTGSISTASTAFEGITGAVEAFATGIYDSGQAAAGWAQYWGDAVGAAYDSFGDFVASGLQSFEDFGDNLKQIARRIISDLVSTFLRSNLRIPVSLLGGSASGAASAGGLLGGGGGGIGGLLGGLFGGGGLLGGFGVATGATATSGAFAGAVASGSAGLGGAAALLGPIALLGGAIFALSRLFGSNKPPDVRFGGESASIRNREGRFSTVFGGVQAGSRQLSYEEMIEPIQQFDLAIQGIVQATGGGAEQLTAISTALSMWEVDLRGSAATAENVLGSRFGAILSTFNADVQGFVGSTGTLEERLSRFTDALSIAAIAAGDNGISSNFGELADLLTRFRLSGEGVADTFQRLTFGVGLIDDTLLMLGGTFGGTRLQAANFAGELINLAGGLDQFATRLNGALEALFTEPERNQFLLDQARASLNSALAGLNISGTGVDNIREQLRTQLRDAMAAGNSALVNELLIAGNALGAFTQAVGRVGDEAGAALTGMFGSSNAAGTIGPGSLTSPAGTAVQTQIQAVQTTNNILQTQTGLLTQIATNTAPSTGANGVKSGGGEGAILARIEALIQQAVRTQVTEALKRTTGANKRAATA